MRWLLPKSLNGHLLLGLVILAGPLLLALLNATVQMRRLTASSQRLVLDSVQSTRVSQDMYAQIALLERSARLYQVLGDAKVLTAFREQDSRLAGDVAQLRGQLRGSDVRAELSRLTADQSGIRTMVQNMQPPATAAPATESPALSSAFDALSDVVSTVAVLSNQQIDSDLAALAGQSAAARRQLFKEAAMLVPLIIIAVLLFTLLLGRPLRQIDRAIAELGDGKLAHAIEVSGPVDLARLGSQLEWLRNRLLELAQERNRFLRHMSHELKTPLANIREGTELLMDGAVGELGTGQREVTAILRENGLKLQRLIENLLSFSAWQSNSTGLELSEFRLRPLVKQVLESQQLTLVSQRVRLDVQIEDLTLVADRGKIRLILENLLSNAIKYSPRGGVIHMRASAGDDACTLEVADCGAGIPREDRARIFDAFHTGRAPGGHVRGTGIGLSVVNEFVHVHSGTVQIVEGEYPGAHFRICMPLRTLAGMRPKEQAHAA